MRWTTKTNFIFLYIYSYLTVCATLLCFHCNCNQFVPIISFKRVLQMPSLISWASFLKFFFRNIPLAHVCFISSDGQISINGLSIILAFPSHCNYNTKVRVTNATEPGKTRSWHRSRSRHLGNKASKGRFIESVPLRFTAPHIRHRCRQ